MLRSFVKLLLKRLDEPTHFIQILLGPRQVGKTTGVKQLQEQKTGHFFLYFSADQIFSSHAEWLKQCWLKARLNPHKKKVLVIDEIQLVEGWSQLVKSLWDEDKTSKKSFHVILLGSSSLELHQGLSESLTGRFELTQVMHWGFQESTELKKGLTFDDYLSFGGYPALLAFNDHSRRKNYLIHSIVEPVISKDILQNVTVKNPALFKQSFEIACSYGGQILSYNKFLGQLQDKGNIDLVKYYLSLFEKAFLIRTIDKFSTSPIQKKGSSPKILPLCTAFMGLMHDADLGRRFEVAVGIELMHQGYDLFYWKDGNAEVDYVIRSGKNILGIEVKSGNKQGLHGLQAFSKKFPRAKTYLVTMDHFPGLVDAVRQLME